DLLIESAQVEGFQSESDFGITVVLDTRLSDELIEEGFVREIISKIQTMRKDSGFEVMDNINIYVEGNEKIKDIMERNAEEIKGDVLALAIKSNSRTENSKEWNINGEKVTLGVEKA
ncbi:MAG: isoleucine--tRNA ligase, partial [Clostridia bacterium]|nr:isoleucine--tRNA ligase [Clostridia bacterium]